MLLIDDADFYANCKVWKNVKGKSIADIAYTFWENIVDRSFKKKGRLKLHDKPQLPCRSKFFNFNAWGFHLTHYSNFL